MARLATRKERLIDEDFTALETSLALVASNLNRDVAKVIELTAFMHDSIISSTGDLDEDDRADSNAKISPVVASIQTNLQQLFECYNVYNEDPVIYAQNLADLIAKYPNAEPIEVAKRYI